MSLHILQNIRLEKGAFYNRDGKPYHFGLITSQTRSQKFIQNTSWYNKKGYKIGWGDLSPQDIRNIMKNIHKDELFIVLQETESFWKFVFYGDPVLGDLFGVSHTDIENPSNEFLIQYCQFLIGRRKLYYVHDKNNHNKVIEFKQLPITIINREEARKLIE